MDEASFKLDFEQRRRAVELEEKTGPRVIELAAEVILLRDQIKALTTTPQAATWKYFPTPLRFIEPDSDHNGPEIVDAKGWLVAKLYWPAHQADETEAAEQETYALGRAMANAMPVPPLALDSWRCSVCNLLNPEDATYCRQCEHRRSMRGAKRHAES